MGSNTILVGITDSDGGLRAFDWAAERAASLGQELHVISVIGGATGSVGDQAAREEREFQTEQRLMEIVRPRREAGLPITTEAISGDPVRILLERSKDVALLVIGSDRLADDQRARGEHGSRITAGAACPVVVVAEIVERERSGVVVGVDGSSISEAAIAFAAGEAVRLGEPLIALGVWTPLQAVSSPVLITSEYKESLQNLTEETVTAAVAGIREAHPELEVRVEVEAGFPSAVILRHARTARLAVVGSHGRGAIARFLLGSVSTEVLARPTSVIAVVR